MKKFVLLLVVAVTLLAAGCGGGGATGGSGGGGGGGNNGSGRSASGDAARGFIAFSKSSGLTGYNRSNGSGQLGGLVKYAMPMLRGLSPLGRDGGWQYDSDYGIYYKVEINTETRLRYIFTNDPNNPTDGGFVDMQLIDGLPYPATVKMDFAIKAGVYRMAGTMSVTLYDDTGQDYRITANIQWNQPQQALAYDLRYRPSAITGQLSVASQAGRVSYTNIVYTSNRFDCKYNANGLTGTLTYYADGSGMATANTSGGVWTLTWDSNYDATLRSPDGREEYVGNLLSS